MDATDAGSLSEILATYDLEWKEEGRRIEGQKKPTPYRPIRKYLWLGVLVIVIGIAFAIAGSIFIGLGTVLASAYLFRTYWQLTNRLEVANNLRFEINDQEVHVREGYQTRKIPLSEVRELKYKIDEKMDVVVGNVSVVTERGVVHTLLEIFGSDAKEVKDHIVLLAQHLGDYCFEPGE
jgi:hypothetical protein